MKGQVKGLKIKKATASLHMSKMDRKRRYAKIEGNDSSQTEVRAIWIGKPKEEKDT